MKTHPLKSVPQILGEVNTFDRLDQHVIHICFHCDVYHPCKQLVHHPLVGDINVDQIEGHDSIVIDITMNIESSVASIALNLLYLTVP